MGLSTAVNAAARATERNPTDAQKESGNYAKGKVRLHGLEIAIENPKGGTRSGTDKGGKPWRVTMPAHYGYVKGTEGRDGDHVDVYIGPRPDSDKVWVVDQVDAGSKKFDEHKCMLGYASKADAVSDYKRAFSDGKGSDRIGSVTELSVDSFKTWLRSGKTKTPMAKTNTSSIGLSRAMGGRVGYAGGGTPFGERFGLGPDMMPYESLQEAMLASVPVSRIPSSPEFGDMEFVPEGSSRGDPQWPLVVPRKALGALREGLPMTMGMRVKPQGELLEMAKSTMKRMGYDRGGDVPLSDSGPLPGQDWPDNYDPEAGLDFLRMLQAGGLGAAKALAPPMPRWPSSREEALEMIGEPKSLGQFTAEEVVPAGLSVVMPGVGRAAGRAIIERPLAALLSGFGLGTAGAVAASESRAQDKWDPETAKGPYNGPKRNSIETKGIQERAAAQGLYPSDKIDGIDSGGTRAAEWELIKRERREAAQQRMIEQEAATRATQAETAKTEAANKAAADKRAGEERKEGLSKFEAAKKDPANDPWLTPNLGYGLGAGLGGLLGLGTSFIFDRRARGLMEGANKLLENVGAKGKAAGTLSERISKINDFARTGGAGENVPFKRAATQDPPWKANPKATEASNLYPARSMTPEYITQGLLAGSGLTEMGVSMAMSHGAHKRLAAAEAAVKENPNPATIAAYLDARNSANMWDSLDNMGRSWALTQGTAAKLGPMTFGGDRRPNISKYEGELGEVSKKLRKDKLKAKAYEEKVAADKESKQLQKQERAAARAAKKKSGSGAAGTALVGAPLLLRNQSASEEPALPISPELTLSNSMETEGFRSRGGPAKHHSHYQPRDRKTGRYRGGPVYPQHGADTDRSQGGPAVMPSALNYAAGGSTGKGGGYPYYPPDYGNDKATSDLVFAQRQRRDVGGLVEEIEAPQPGYTYGRPRFPNLDPRAYLDRPTLSRYVNESNLSRAMDMAPNILTAAMIAAGPRDRSMAKVKDADAFRMMDRHAGRTGKVEYDPGISGGEPNPYNLSRWRDSSLDLAMKPGMRNAEWNPLVRPYDGAPPRATNEPFPFNVIQGGMRNMGGPVGYEDGGIVSGPIVGDHGGRDDTRPVSVESGSFVIPSDVVSYMGDGNTLRGFKVLESQFGPTEPARAQGGGVPIRISDGEYSLSPKQVARVGGGNVEQGHALLDKMVLALRKRHVDQLKSLPAPAKS